MAPSLHYDCFAAEQLKPCHGLSAPENGARSPEKRLHPAGATVHFSCAPGYVLKGQASIKCVPGHPSHWSDPPPICRAGECPDTPPKSYPAKMTNVENQNHLPIILSCYFWSSQFLPNSSDLASLRQMLEWALLGQILPMISPLSLFLALVVWPIVLIHCPLSSPLVLASLDGFYSGRSLDGESPHLRARKVISLHLVLIALRSWTPKYRRQRKSALG